MYCIHLFLNRFIVVYIIKKGGVDLHRLIMKKSIHREACVLFSMFSIIDINND